MELDDEKSEEHRQAWIEAEYETMGWEKIEPLDERVELPSDK